MRLQKLYSKKLADLNAYLVVVKDQYNECPSEELKEAVEQTSDLIEITKEEYDELV
jgi:hypothetical protein